MKINMETDYAFRIMRALARKGGLTDASTIAESAAVPQRFTLKILGKLVTSGLVMSKKGANGGYALSRDPKEITLLDILEVIEGPIVMSKCLGDDFVCRHDGVSEHCDCFFNRVFDDISITIANKLKSVTVADSI
ncbi:MAG: Rrf2 family transcriptional regulator [Clostridia bacterium]|nr:Rrf2 family transcriptional regulator [Clostridia bacterium]